jgi:hypothetical protein
MNRGHIAPSTSAQSFEILSSHFPQSFSLNAVSSSPENPLHRQFTPRTSPERLPQRDLPVVRLSQEL